MSGKAKNNERNYFSKKKDAQYRICLPVKFLTEFSCRPGSRYSPCGSQVRTQTRTSLRLSNPTATQSSLRCLLTRLKNHPNGWFFNGAQYRICLPVKFLTEFSCRPGSRYSPCGSQVRTQTRTSLRLSNPTATQSSLRCLLTRLKNHPNGWFFNGAQYRI